MQLLLDLPEALLMLGRKTFDRLVHLGPRAVQTSLVSMSSLSLPCSGCYSCILGKMGACAFPYHWIDTLALGRRGEKLDGHSRMAYQHTQLPFLV